MTLLVSGAATLVALMNYTAPMTVLPAVATDLGAGLGGQTWILNGIALGLAALLLTVGSLADNLGRRRIFVLGSAVLAVASVLCAVASTTWVFVLGRGLQGAASAALIAAGLGLVAHAYPDAAARVRATAIWGAMLGLGIALGPIASSVFLAAGGWRFFYLALAVVSVAVGGGAIGWVRESRAATARRVDLPGMVAFSVAVAAVVTALTLGRDGWLRPVVLGLLAVGVVALVGFLVLERRRRAPMLDLALFRGRGFVAATAGAFANGLAVIGLMSYFPTLLQRAWHLAPVPTAWLLAIWSGSSFLAALQARRLGDRIPPGHRFVLGLVLAAAGDLVLVGAIDAASWTRVVVGLLVSGIGSGILNATLAGQAVATVPAASSSMGSGANNTARYVGSSVGVALVVALSSTTGHDLGAGANLVLVAAAVTTLLAAGILYLLTKTGREVSR